MSTDLVIASVIVEGVLVVPVLLPMAKVSGGGDTVEGVLVVPVLLPMAKVSGSGDTVVMTLEKKSAK